jgi:hypothetical protein
LGRALRPPRRNRAFGAPLARSAKPAENRLDFDPVRRFKQLREKEQQCDVP